MAIAQSHFILQTDHVLTAAEISELESNGVQVQHVLSDSRYMIRAADPHSLAGDPRVRTVTAYGALQKIARSAVREAARGAYATVRLIFHDDVEFHDAQRAIEEAGGVLERPLAIDFELPHRAVARILSTSLMQLANDDRVFAIYGPPLHVSINNAVAAQLSHVTPLFSAPYDLSGNGVALSLFDVGAADITHLEFGGRLITHFTAARDLHPTHVSGTMIAAGINPTAKGMSPAAALHQFSALDDYPVVLQNKKQALPALSIVADNNSWGFALGWQPGAVWWGGEELLGAYDGFYSAPYDQMARSTPVLFVHSAGNDGVNGINPVSGPWFPHAHVDDNGNLISAIFCYSQNGSGTDCPAPTCSTGITDCERTPHPTYGPYGTIGLLSSTKNAIAVGAVDALSQIAAFSSRGPTRDGRVKPDIVAKGVSQYSTALNGTYQFLSGTSMSAPVVTGITGLITEQWKKTFNGTVPSPETLKILLIAGADDLGNRGPDYTFGFGLANAKASIDLILAGSRIRSGAVSQGQQIEATFTLATAQDVRVVLGWADPEVLLLPDDFATKTLVNDLDLQVIDPNGNTVLPYVLDRDHPDAAATRGVNTVDNVEEIEIQNAIAGTYRVIIRGSAIAYGTSQQYVLVANAPLEFPHGDANGDGQVTVADIFSMLNALFMNGSAPMASVDVNGDGQFTVADIFYLINYLFAGGPAPR